MLATFWMLAALSGGAWSQPGADPACKISKGPAYLGARDVGKTSVVVFVHGVLSDAVGAWSDGGDHFWPCLLRAEAEPVFATSNIYLHAYRTEPLGQSPNIEKVGRLLLRDLQADAVFAHAHITIVAHSMGGLVVSRMLLQMNADPELRPLLQRVRLVQYYGTPATGAEIANIASQISGNVQFEEMRRQVQPQDLVAQWTAVRWPFRWYCLAEGKRTGWFMFIGTQVVSRESASALCRDRPAAFDVLEGYDHISMVKPASVQDQPHRVLLQHFKACVAGGIVAAPAGSEAGTPEGQLLLAMFADLRSRLGDVSDAGRLVMQKSVQDALFQSSAWSDQYFMPRDIARPGLTQKDQERLGARVFANEFVNKFQPVAASLTPQWVTRLGAVEGRVPDGQLIELRRQWIAAGLALDGDYVAGLELPSVPGQVLVVAAIQPDASGVSRGRMRGLLVVSPEPQTCL